MPAGPGTAVGRGELAVRILAATAGAYAAGWLYTSLLALLLVRGGVERSNAVAWATLTAYPVILAVFLLAFAVRSVVRLGICLAAAIGTLALAATALG